MRIVSGTISGAISSHFCDWKKLVLGASVGALMAGCAASTPENTNFFPKASELFATPDWGVFAGAKSSASRTLGPEDYVSGDGSCAGGPAPVAVATPAPEGDADNQGGNVLPAAAPAGPTVSGGIGLGMTECEVAQRAGAASQVDLGTDEHGERSAVLSYMRGDRPGIYRFRAGRLVSIERVAMPEPEKPKKPAKKTKSAKPKKPSARTQQPS